MVSIRPFQKKVGSLFFKLLISFIVIILLPVSFNFVSYAFFRTNLEDKLIENNSLVTDTTVKHYEDHIRMIKNFEFTQFLKANTSNLNREKVGGIDYAVVTQLRNELQSYLTNPSLYLYNMMFVLNNLDLAFDKDGSAPLHDMFDKFYYNDTYNYDFWQKEISGVNGFKVYASSEFSLKTMGAQKNSGSLMPVLFSSSSNKNIAIIALLDNDKMSAEFYQPVSGSRLYILDEKNDMLFASDSRFKSMEFPAMDLLKGYVKVGTDYIFYQKGTISGFTYVNVIPTSQISSQISRLNLILASILILSLLLSIAASIFFSVRLNNPLRKIVESIRQLNFSVPPQSQIKEFNLISEKISDLIRANLVIHQDLDHQNSLLKYYAYTNKFKNIHGYAKGVNIPLDIDKPFMLIGFQLLFNSRLKRDMDIEQDKAANFFKEYINADLTGAFAETLTFQIENDIILSLVFIEKDNSPKLEEYLQRWKRVFDLDREYCLVSIAVSETYYHTAKFPDAYKHILQLLDGRRPGDETQIITEAGSKDPTYFDSDEDHVFYANLEMGNASELFQIVKRRLNYLDRKRATLRQMHEYATEVIRKVNKATGRDTSLRHTAENAMILMPPFENVRECYTLNQLERYLEWFLNVEVTLIRRKNEETDPIIDVVTDYINAHLGDDITLDLLADKLSITGTYLSTYFKQKKGINFSEYINNVRMRKAQELLETTDLKVLDIASMVGYYSVNAFIRKFKKFTGIPPGEFRKVIIDS
ncbi:helix-turn-helix domain-containing protein [Paenibacillus sp. LMG 31460]|uniref:Helix-turn-helix domain-containing protein n=1 Tax=Paenibacillus germinis TaxID=2654979 RepID=A0ABX1YZS2_9BACL|nr:AraC family transcriptional regulator [Paenibacillus germinis]NOU86642.1 helix-turn-helix domain-containing protein [Paenibacillus germinis]